ncbi:MAG: hypothetical protein HC923_10100, partial [Myxococcales bacterium]|nr:hypothetical protein [Myxococcales bacterium]
MQIDVGFVLDRRNLTADEARALIGGLRELWARPLPRVVFVDRAKALIEQGELARGISLLLHDAEHQPGSAGPCARRARSRHDATEVVREHHKRSSRLFLRGTPDRLSGADPAPRGAGVLTVHKEVESIAALGRPDLHPLRRP